jgi:hypothetical protein
MPQARIRAGLFAFAASVAKKNGKTQKPSKAFVKK